MLSPDGRRIANHETVESVLDVPELEPLTVSPRMGATDGATDDPPSPFSGFRLVGASNVVPVKIRHKPATDNLVVERFREGHNNIEHLCIYPLTGLQDLIGACVRFQTHVEFGARAYEPNEGMYTVKGNAPGELTFDEVVCAACKLGYALRPWVDRQENRQHDNRNYGRQDNRGYGRPNQDQNRGNPQQGGRFTPNTGTRTPNPN